MLSKNMYLYNLQRKHQKGVDLYVNSLVKRKKEEKKERGCDEVNSLVKKRKEKKE